MRNSVFQPGFTHFPYFEQDGWLTEKLQKNKTSNKVGELNQREGAQIQ